MKEDCIFCKLANGVFDTVTVYEDEDFRAIMDIAPAAKGHVLLLPKEHMADLLEMDENVANKALPILQKIANAMKEEFRCDGINMLQNNGKAAGQTVFHLHFHLIPRYDEDHVILPWKTLSYEEGEALAVANSIKKHL